MEFGSGGGGGGDDEERKWRDREALRHIIGQWNANRLDLFSLSEPNEVNTTVKLAATHHCNYNHNHYIAIQFNSIILAHPLFIGIRVPRRDAVLLPGRGPEDSHKVHPCEFDGIDAGRHRDAD